MKINKRRTLLVFSILSLGLLLVGGASSNHLSVSDALRFQSSSPRVQYPVSKDWASPIPLVKEQGATLGRPALRYPGELLLRLPDRPEILSRLKALAWIESLEEIAGDTFMLHFREDLLSYEEVLSYLRSEMNLTDIEPNWAILEAAPTTKTVHSRVSHQELVTQNNEAEAFSHEACLIDSQVNSNLPLLGQTKNFAATTSQLSSAPSHGTLVYGIIAGLADKPLSEMDDDLRICAANIFEPDGYARLSSLLKSLQWAAQRTKLINMSLGFYSDSTFLRDAIFDLQRRDVTVVAAAGNDATASLMYPAAYPHVLAIGSLNSEFQRSDFSNWMPNHSIFLPGENLPAVKAGGYTERLTGTSAAAALYTHLLLKTVTKGYSQEQAQELLKDQLIEQYQKGAQLPQSLKMLDPENLLAHMSGSPISHIVITRFASQGEFLQDEETPIHITWHSETDSPKLPFSIKATDPTGRRMIIPINASLVQRSGKESRLTISWKHGEIPGWNESSRVQLSLQSSGIRLKGPQTLDLSRRPPMIQNLKIRELSIQPLDFQSQGIDHSLSIMLQNRGLTQQGELTVKLYRIPAVHEGLARTPKQWVASFPLEEAICSGCYQEFRFQLPPLSFAEKRFTFFAELTQGESILDSFFKSYRQNKPYQALPLYSQEVHRYMVNEAVNLLKLQDIKIKDLDDGELQKKYLGVVSHKNKWLKIGPEDFNLPTQTLEVSGYWTDSLLDLIKNQLGIDSFTLLDGAHDADSVDIVYGYSFEDVFDSHFWIVDSYDDDGLNSNGSNHHSALTKIRALLYGGGKLQHGAIDHYKQGHVQAAWWLLGHAAHLLGDLTVPSHVNDENAHGTYGDAYHDWMDDGAFRRWSANHPLVAGKGFVDPFHPRNQGDPVRYLAYTAAQLGNSYAWASTAIGTTIGKEGNRVAAGDFPHYEDAMQDLFAVLPHRPLREWHINKDEVKDVFGKCDLVDWIGPTEKVTDCKDRDGHKDRDNTDRHGNDDDGDMSRIGDSNFTYGIRAIAGLLYFFAKETGQL